MNWLKIFPRRETSCTKKKGIQACPPAPTSTVAGENSIPFYRDVEQDLEILRVNIDSISRDNRFNLKSESL